jgi:hypothetical protein
MGAVPKVDRLSLRTRSTSVIPNALGDLLFRHCFELRPPAGQTSIIQLKQSSPVPSMPFNHDLVEAQLALHHIGTTDMPKLAWDALEVGLDGPATRRLAALHFPTFFQIREILPNLLREWRMTEISPEDAALRLAKLRARQILQSNEDPLVHNYDFWNLWMESGYCRALHDFGPLADDVHVARECGQTDDEIRALLLEKLKALAAM